MDPETICVYQVCLEQGVEPGSMFTMKEAIKHLNPEYKLHATVVTATADHLDRASFKTAVSKLSDTMKTGDRKPILVLTKKDTLNDSEIVEVKNKIKVTSNSDLVYCVANYVCPSTEDIACFIPPRRFDTEQTVLTLLETFFREADRRLLFNAREKWNNLMNGMT